MSHLANLTMAELALTPAFQLMIQELDAAHATGTGPLEFHKLATKKMVEAAASALTIAERN